jgi:hypothetical protein
MKPIITFYRLSSSVPDPTRADPSVGGTIPTRAFRYCEPVRAASSFGWYVYSPRDFMMLWDGSHFFYKPFDPTGAIDNREVEWLPLVSPVALDSDIVPCPAMLTPIDGGMVQIGFGFVVETAPDWSTLIRPVANYRRDTGYEAWEGIVETDRWLGPLFINVQLVPRIGLVFPKSRPIAQLQPVHRHAYSEEILGRSLIVENLDEEHLARYRKACARGAVGAYAVAARQRAAEDPRSIGALRQ